jgi:CAP-Gly domain-containing linker protein 1
MKLKLKCVYRSDCNYLNLGNRLSEKQKELQEEMEDRDKAENRLIHMESTLAEREKELLKLHEEMAVLQQKTSDSSRLLSAYTSLEKEKRNLEEKIVELQVAAARSNSADTQTGTYSFNNETLCRTLCHKLSINVRLDADSRVQELKRDYEMSQREINFLNSVIVDMQKKVDDMKIQLEVSQATLYGQNVNENNHSL